MQAHIQGIHHITAIAGDPQKNIDFYCGVLGLRMVKKTINFDAPDVYHFYFGDRVGTPGTVFTTFPFKGARKGTKGVGEVQYTAFSIPKGSLDFWRARVKRFGFPISDTLTRFGEAYIRFEDHDGMGIELIEASEDARVGWGEGPVPEEYAIKGFYGATLTLRSREATVKLLTGFMNYRFIAEENGRYRYGTAGRPGDIVDIVEQPEGRTGVQSAGSVHHIAFRTADGSSQREIQGILHANGYSVTEVKDRNYFTSIYFREPGGVLFEIATDTPGFAIDEDEALLGEALKLPGWAEKHRDKIEESLHPVTLDYSAYV
ncbi:glyoxalase/bleomycin resistance protein/dioxygenase [Nitritalea halalkaliphila LW7]|uniref:Glyoxalase/bleomycin resistance protein/dioxygenase n=1 Tax=Nitritalea halalkaliphila LW7 TaxID=1189621 RepID=I5CA12_9BACT|nr:ring-cleaving dioxygenase [Nitritalea halalkaliphila]EIM78664.1 glyoxalase/bleomycin resistance protein/dioxygenase [Nitritalea halalkaliphila LW7]